MQQRVFTSEACHRRCVLCRRVIQAGTPHRRLPPKEGNRPVVNGQATAQLDQWACLPGRCVELRPELDRLRRMRRP